MVDKTYAQLGGFGRELAPLDRVFEGSIFPTVKGTRIEAWKGSLRDLETLVRKTRAPSKKDLPLYKMSRFGDERTEQGSLRSDANLRAFAGVEGDYDGGEVSIEQAADLLVRAGVAALLYETPSGSPEAPRWRAMLPLSKNYRVTETARALRDDLVDRANGALGGVLADESWTRFQTFYIGHVDGKTARTFLVDGRFLDEADDIPHIGKVGVAASKTKSPRYTGKGAGSADTRREEGSDLAQSIAAQGLRTRGTGQAAVDFTTMVRAIPNVESPYPHYVKVVVAIHYETGGADWGRELAREWAAKIENGNHDDADFARTWKGASDKRARPLTGRWLAGLARGAGWRPALAAGDSAVKGGDIANADGFAARYGDEFLYVQSTREWVRWTGERWQTCRRGEQTEAAKEYARGALAEAAKGYSANPTESAKAALKRAQALHDNKQRLDAMLALAKSDPSLAAISEEFDSDPNLVGVRNGVVDLTIGMHRTARAEDMIRKLAGVAFDPDAKCPKFLQFLSEVQPAPENRAFLQRAAGYTLTGDVSEEKLFFLYGTGANGKSVFVNTLGALLGDYGVSIQTEALMKSNHNDADRMRAIVQLPGARMALGSETSVGRIWNDQAVKLIASRDPIPARLLYREVFTFKPTHKAWFVGNHRPGAHDASDGFWRRMILVPFARTIPREERDPQLERTIIETELPGTLNWAIEGLKAWRKSGLKPPVAIETELNQYRGETDLLGQWLDEECFAQRGARVQRGDAYNSYRGFCREQGVGPLSQPVFSRQVHERFPEKSKSGGKDFFRGFRLRCRADFSSKHFDDIV